MENLIAVYEKIDISSDQHQGTEGRNEEVDPDYHFYYNEMNDCSYYTEDKFNTNMFEGNLSIIHFNIRSLYANYDQMQDYLSSFDKPFNIIAVSEIWINEHKKGMDFHLEGYNLECKNRINRSGGGVALFIDVNINYTIQESMSKVVDNIMECVTIGQETHSSGSGEMVPEINLPDDMDGSVERTTHRVLDSPDDFEMEDRRTRLSEAHDVSDCVSEPFESASDIRSDQRMQDSDVPPAISGRHSAEPQPVVTEHEDVATDALTVYTQPRGFENTAARTGRGRAINPLKRLICEINEQVLDTPESTVRLFYFFN